MKQINKQIYSSAAKGEAFQEVPHRFTMTSRFDTKGSVRRCVLKGFCFGRLYG